MISEWSQKVIKNKNRNTYSDPTNTSYERQILLAYTCFHVLCNAEWIFIKFGIGID